MLNKISYQIRQNKLKVKHKTHKDLIYNTITQCVNLFKLSKKNENCT